MRWPTALALDNEDNIYMSDDYLQRISIFDRDGNYLSKWGTKGSGVGEFDGPSGLAFDSEDNLLVVDHRNNRVQRYTKDGRFLNEFGESGDGEWAELSAHHDPVRLNHRKLDIGRVVLDPPEGVHLPGEA